MSVSFVLGVIVMVCGGFWILFLMLICSVIFGGKVLVLSSVSVLVGGVGR